MNTEHRITRDEHLERGRAAYDSKAWTAAVEHLMAADEDAPLDLDDLERLGLAAHLIGRDDVAVQIGMRGFAAGVAAGEIERAARAGFWAGMGFALHGDVAQAGAWIARSADLIEKSGRDCVESGYLLIPTALGQEDAHDWKGALATFEQIEAVAERFGDADLAAIGRLGRGEALMELGERDRGTRSIDEAMASVTAGEVSEAVAGMVYCGTVEACQKMFDLRRAHEWTAALTAWCDSQPDLVFRGRCRVYRAELMRLHGDWTSAADEAERARVVLAGPPVSPAIGEAHYEAAELHRLSGRFDAAERSYAEGSQFGRRPEPGLALLRLGQGRAASARSVIARALDEDPANPRLLEAAVTIALARRDVDEARTLVGRLRGTTGTDVPALLEAIVARAEGEVLLAEGEPSTALRVLRRAWHLWQELDAPFDAARARVGIARACRALGDEETAALEAAAARRVFEDLGAAPALAELDRLDGQPPHGLSPREIEVLRHLASGRTNREIADELGISERTVDRHVSNLYTKLDVSTRAAATAWAYERNLS
jgi:DNA-binding CsgD family transcriptional regulator